MSGRACPICGVALVHRRVDAEVCGPACRRERSRIRALLAGESAGPYATVAQWAAGQQRRANRPQTLPLVLGP